MCEGVRVGVREYVGECEGEVCVKSVGVRVGVSALCVCVHQHIPRQVSCTGYHTHTRNHTVVSCNH